MRVLQGFAGSFADLPILRGGAGLTQTIPTSAGLQSGGAARRSSTHITIDDLLRRRYAYGAEHCAIGLVAAGISRKARIIGVAGVDD